MVLLEQTQVADGLCYCSLRLADVVGVVTNHLVQHLLRVLSCINQSVDVCLSELCNTAEDGLLSHNLLLSVHGLRGSTTLLVSRARITNYVADFWVHAVKMMHA